MLQISFRKWGCTLFPLFTLVNPLSVEYWQFWKYLRISVYSLAKYSGSYKAWETKSNSYPLKKIHFFSLILSEILSKRKQGLHEMFAKKLYQRNEKILLQMKKNKTKQKKIDASSGAEKLSSSSSVNVCETSVSPLWIRLRTEWAPVMRIGWRISQFSWHTLIDIVFNVLEKYSHY